MHKDTSKRAPGPRGHFLLGILSEFQQDAMGFLLKSHQDYGHIVRFRLGPHTIHGVSHPDHIQHVLRDQYKNYDKNTRSAQKIKGIGGEGLLSSIGPLWLRQRRLMQPTFHLKRVESFVESMADSTASFLTRWESFAEKQEPFDVASEMMHLTYVIVGKMLFSTDIMDESDDVEAALGVVLEHTYHRVETIIDIPETQPSHRN